MVHLHKQPKDCESSYSEWRLNTNTKIPRGYPPLPYAWPKSSWVSWVSHKFSCCPRACLNLLDFTNAFKSTFFFLYFQVLNILFKRCKIIDCTKESQQLLQRMLITGSISLNLFCNCLVESSLHYQLSMRILIPHKDLFKDTLSLSHTYTHTAPLDNSQWLRTR